MERWASGDPREDNAFQYAKDLLPAAEGVPLMAAFDREMGWLFAMMHEGKKLDSAE